MKTAHDKLIKVANEIIDILNNRDLMFIEGLLILDIIKNELLKKVRSEKNE